MQQSIDTGIGLLPGQKEPWMIRPLYRAECHLFEHRGTHILFDVTSGDFFQVDALIRDILTLGEDLPVIELLDLLKDRHSEKEILSACKELLRDGILSDSPPEPTRPFAPPGRLEVVHLGLDITYDRLSGSHIFTRDTEASPPSAYMEDEVARKAIDLLLKESGRIRQCHVTFQGGDPLLNAQLVEKVIDYGLEQAGRIGKEILFEVASDSRLLNEQIFGHLKKKNADILVKMTDSPTDELPLVQGSGPYSLSSGEIQDYIRNKKSAVHLQGGVNRNTLNLSERVDQGLTRYPSTRSLTLTFTPLPPDAPDAIAENDLPRALAELETLADYVKAHVLNKETAWIGNFEDDIAQVLNRKTSFYYCGAGTRYLTVAPDGNLYVCPGLVGKEAFRVGDVRKGIDRQKQKKWIKSTHVEKFEACATCWARYLCGGGCRLDSFLGSGQIEAPNPVSCTLIRRSYELAMATCLDIASEDPEALQRRYGGEVA